MIRQRITAPWDGMVRMEVGVESACEYPTELVSLMFYGDNTRGRGGAIPKVITSGFYLGAGFDTTYT